MFLETKLIIISKVKNFSNVTVPGTKEKWKEHKRENGRKREEN